MRISLSLNVPANIEVEMPTLYGVKAGEKFVKRNPNDNFLKIIYHE
jgi:hypothetical protein